MTWVDTRASRRGKIARRFQAMHRRKMKRTIYQVLMSVLAGTLIGSLVANLVNIMDPEFQMDYGVSIAFFAVITWGGLSLLDTLFHKPARPPAASATSATPATSPRR
jgi:hypothetical protein